MENMKGNFLFNWNIGYTKFITNEGTEWQWVIEQFKNALEFVIPIIIPAKYHFVLHSPIQREVSNSVFPPSKCIGMTHTEHGWKNSPLQCEMLGNMNGG